MHNIVYKQWRQRAINETNMNKINGSDNMKLSAENPATAHTRDRYKQAEPRHRHNDNEIFAA